MTFPIKKRINTELFVDGNICKWEIRKQINKIADLLEESKTETGGK